MMTILKNLSSAEFEDMFDCAAISPRVSESAYQLVSETLTVLFARVVGK